MKQTLFNHIKNIYGWKTKRKIVVISVDDYGNVRLDSKEARQALDSAGINKVLIRFDQLDTLENREDLEMLFDALSSVKDKNGKHAVFTPFALPCNINYEKMASDNYEQYHYELLPETYAKLSQLQPKAYEGTWKLWQEGINKGLMKPQFHGREHLNLKVFKEKLLKKDFDVLTNLKNRSYTSISKSAYPTIKVTAAFDFWEYEENEVFENIIKDGLNRFEQVFGYKSVHFNPPGGREHPVIHGFLKDMGVKYLDTLFVKSEHQGKGKFKKSVNWTGKKNNLGQTYQVRNVVFEPTENIRNNWVDYSLKQIETAFFWNRPAIISSHRVNFCGHISPENRAKGISELKLLLSQIVKRWPDVEFMSADELGALTEMN